MSNCFFIDKCKGVPRYVLQVAQMDRADIRRRPITDRADVLRRQIFLAQIQLSQICTKRSRRRPDASAATFAQTPPTQNQHAASRRVCAPLLGAVSCNFAWFGGSVVMIYMILPKIFNNKLGCVISKLFSFAALCLWFGVVLLVDVNVFFCEEGEGFSQITPQSPPDFYVWIIVLCSQLFRFIVCFVGGPARPQQKATGFLQQYCCVGEVWGE